MLRFIFSVIFILNLICTPIFAQQVNDSSQEQKSLSISEITQHIQNIEKNISNNTLLKNESVSLIKELNTYYIDLQLKKEIAAE